MASADQTCNPRDCKRRTLSHSHPRQRHWSQTRLQNLNRRAGQRAPDILNSSPHDNALQFLSRASLLPVHTGDVIVRGSTPVLSVLVPPKSALPPVPSVIGVVSGGGSETGGGAE